MPQTGHGCFDIRACHAGVLVLVPSGKAKPIIIAVLKELRMIVALIPKRSTQLRPALTSASTTTPLSRILSSTSCKLDCSGLKITIREAPLKCACWSPFRVFMSPVPFLYRPFSPRAFRASLDLHRRFFFLLFQFPFRMFRFPIRSKQRHANLTHLDLSTADSHINNIQKSDTKIVSKTENGRLQEDFTGIRAASP